MDREAAKAGSSAWSRSISRPSGDFIRLGNVLLFAGGNPARALSAYVVAA
jgi:hypothetical protein